MSRKVRPYGAARSPVRRAVALVASALVALLVFAAAAQAATFTVNTTVDNLPASGECAGAAGDCSFRQAIDKADSSPGDDTITFALPAGSTIALTNGDLEVSTAPTDATTITGPGADSLTIDQTTPGPHAVIDFLSGSSVTLSGMTITGGHGLQGAANGINSFVDSTLDGVVVSGNSVTLKGGVAVGGVLNWGFGRGGPQVPAQQQGWGAPSPRSLAFAPATMTIVNSTISNNSVLGSNGNSGGGVGNFGDLRIENSTVSGNQVTTTTAFACGAGGGVWNPTHGCGLSTSPGLIAVDSTIAGNSVDVGAGGIDNESTASLADTIVAKNTTAGSSTIDAPDCATPGGTTTSHGYNLIGNGDGCSITTAAGDRIGTGAGPIDPHLGALGANGGPTATMALLDGSPAINAGDPSTPSDADPTGVTGLIPCRTSDQRGVSRPQGSACDIGAFEAQAPQATTTAAGGVTSSAATLNGVVNPLLLTGTVHFEYGTTTAYGTSTAPQTVAAGSSAAPVAAAVSGLAAGTTYHFRVVAVTAVGTSAGGDMTFTTPAVAAAPVRCIVPNLHGKTVAQAVKLLRRAHCRLGKVRRSKLARRGPHKIVSQGIRRNRTLTAGTRVPVALSISPAAPKVQPRFTG